MICCTGLFDLLESPEFVHVGIRISHGPPRPQDRCGKMCEQWTKRKSPHWNYEGGRRTFTPLSHWDSLKHSNFSTMAARPSEKKMRILVLTFKNHALDEFLLDCRKHCPEADIIRIGGQGSRATGACPKSAELQ